ncbi:right-handed parallel beta-helix repeat-containing protein [Candidatus Bathyarchaeota archaeon]|nr:right-handed parallel beta-helix repeat-containing protein [Candidatus Bathyarchaeota archaeon]
MKTGLLGKVVLVLLLLRLVALMLCETNGAASLVIHIRADGEVDPSYVPITRFDNYYRFDDNISGAIVVERSDAVIDGGGHCLVGSGQGTGFYFLEVSNITLENVEIQNFENGVFLYEAYNLSFLECLTKENLFGFKVVSSSQVGVLKCNVSNNEFGLSLQNCSEINIFNNSIMQNSLHGIYSYFSSFSSVCNNSITGNQRGIYFDFSSNNEVVGNNIVGNSYKGVRIAYSNNNLISGNNISANQYGFWFFSASFNRFLENYLAFNDKVGLYIEINSSSNSFFENVIMANSEIGLFVDSSSDNVFLHNNFLMNGENVIFKEQNCSNYWDDDVEGNFWDDYSGVDLNRDGIGDDSYIIDAWNLDGKPLMGFFNRFEIGSGYCVNVISNSTVENFVFFEANGTMRFEVLGNDGFGFCRVMVPRMMVNSAGLFVVIDNGETLVLFPNYEVYSNATYFWIYFAYETGFHEVQILDEYPVWFGLLFFMLFVLVCTKMMSKICPK